MNLADVMEEIKDRLDTITGLRCFGYPPDSAAPPAAIVTYPEEYIYDQSMRRGMDRVTLPVVVMVGRASDRAARDLLGPYCDGAGLSSVKAVLEGAATENFLNLPGGANNFAVSPHRAVQSVTGNLWLAWDGLLDDWTPAAASVLIAKYGATFNVKAYRLQIDTSGRPVATISSTGANDLTATGDALGFTNGTRHAVGVEVVPNDGNGNRTFQFYTAPVLSGPWTPHGALISQAGAVSIFAVTSQVGLGADSQGVGVAAGDVFGAEIRSGDMTGTLVAAPDFRPQTPDASAFIDDVGGAWVMGGTSAIVAGPGLQPYTAFDSVRVQDALIDAVMMGGVEYLAATFNVDIAGPGGT